jgi:SAM-dependent methyltransferase
MNKAFYQGKFVSGQYGGAVYDVKPLLPMLNLRDNYNFLEVGVGTGRFLNSFLAASKTKPGRVCVADLDNYLITDIPLEFEQISLGEKALPYADGSFGLVVCNHVLEHIFETEFALRELRRVMTADGYCVVSVPNIANWWSRFTFALFGEIPLGLETGTESAEDGLTWILRKRFKGFKPSGHIRGFTPRALRDLCERCGFRFAGWWNQNTKWHNKLLGLQMGIVLRKEPASNG